jgi:signal transduction histidine kinase
VTVRLRLALTVLLSGLVAALGVIVACAVAFQRFEHENTWQRADAFLGRVNTLHDDLMDQHRRNPDEFNTFLRNLMVYEPDSQLYLLAADGSVLASTGKMQLAPGFKVALAPVQEAAQAAQTAGVALSGDRRAAAYVMGDDPEYMQTDAVVAARALRPASIRRPGEGDAVGYLYLVSRKPNLPASNVALLRSSLASPAVASVLAVMLVTTALAAWVIITITRPLRVLSDEVAAAARAGFSAASQASASMPPAGMHQNDEFGRLRNGFHAMLATLRMQWDELQRLDSFRREGVANLSHDLRSPLTATVACLETLEQRWQGPSVATAAAHPIHDSDRRLVAVALRNTRNAAGMVRSLGDLASLDEPAYQLHPMRLDLSEVLDDITLRFAERARQQGVVLRFEQRGPQAPTAAVDVELFERALANLLDNALKFTPAGKAIMVVAEHLGPRVRVSVTDEGAGIEPGDLPRLFDRHFQSRSSVAPATSEEGRGLGLAIVKRIVELHQGTVEVTSALGQGTTVTLALPAAV